MDGNLPRMPAPCLSPCHLNCHIVPDPSLQTGFALSDNNKTLAEAAWLLVPWRCVIRSHCDTASSLQQLKAPAWPVVESAARLIAPGLGSMHLFPARWTSDAGPDAHSAHAILLPSPSAASSSAS